MGRGFLKLSLAFQSLSISIPKSCLNGLNEYIRISLWGKILIFKGKQSSHQAIKKIPLKYHRGVLHLFVFNHSLPLQEKTTGNLENPMKSHCSHMWRQMHVSLEYIPNCRGT